MTESLKPFHLLVHDGGKSSFFFMADAFYHAPVMTLLQAEMGINRDYFNGYAWAKLVNILIQSEFRDQAGNIQLDPEADIFSAISNDPQLLEDLALRLKAILNDDVALRALLTTCA